MKQINKFKDKVKDYKKRSDLVSLSLEVAEGCYEAMIKSFVELRKSKSWTLRETAKKLKISAAYLSDIENGKRNMSWDLIKKVQESFID